MIHPSELRIGNWVEHNESWCYRENKGRIRFQWEDRDWYSVGDCTMFIENVFPIEITQEHLEKFGFDVKEKSAWSTGKEVKYKVFTKGNFTYRELQNLWWFYGIILPNQPKYIHSLQNVFYSLTGKEL